jgi:hypothetical protein
VEETEAKVNRASKVTAAVLGAFAGAASIEHGIFEILRGNVVPEGLMIQSMGPPCDPLTAWHGCEPAMTILPSFLISGALAVVIGAFALLWSVAFVQRRAGGLVLILSAVPMLLFGGGIFPPLIAIVAGAVGTQIQRQAPHGTGAPGPGARVLAHLWPWTLIALSAWLLGQWAVGYFFNEFVRGSGLVFPLLIIGLLVVSPIAAVARDRRNGKRDG